MDFRHADAPEGWLRVDGAPSTRRRQALYIKRGLRCQICGGPTSQFATEGDLRMHLLFANALSILGIVWFRQMNLQIALSAFEL